VRTLDIVIPAYNEAASLHALIDRLTAVVNRLPYRTRILVVNDGSTDQTEIVLAALAATCPQLGVIHLSRNFGHQAALTAGLDVADADAVIMMDADLEKPPELIPEFLDAWERGAEVVHGVRRTSRQVSSFKRQTSRMFYRMLNRLSDVPLVNDAPDFRLLDAKVVRAARTLREQDRLLRGLVAWVGFKQVSIPYDEQPRAAGASRYGLMRMIALALDAVLGFSRLPLRVATVAGFVISLIAFSYGGYVAVMHLFYEHPVQGWTSLALLVSVLAGAQMMFLGVFGEYLGQVLMETKARPLYLVSRMQVPALEPAAAENDRRASTVRAAASTAAQEVQ
jgi:polyisoprenyl-phosphate glycosyltransferase